MNRIETALQALQEKKEKAFITYITAGLPDYDKTKAIIKAQEAAGTDIIELGIPFSDPVADGPVIQAASYEGNSRRGKSGEDIYLYERDARPMVCRSRLYL